MRQAALGLHHAHEQGLVHRDVKPSNLLLTDRERLVKVLDLGLARLHLIDHDAGDEPITASGVVIGTPDYRAPEQAVDPRSAGPRSDVYGLGCTLYHLLTGRPPFPGGSLTQKLLRHQNEEPKDPARDRPSVPAGLTAVVLRSLAKDPARRFASAAELAEALSPYRSVSGLKTVVVPDTPLPVDAIVPHTPSRPEATVRREPVATGAYDLANPDPEPLPDHEPETQPTFSQVGQPHPAAPGPETDRSSRPSEPSDSVWWEPEPPTAPHEAAPPERPVTHRSPHGVRSGFRPTWPVALAVLALAVLAGLVVRFVSMPY